MASLAAHFTASLFLCPLGVRRLFCSVSLYLRNPSLYRSRIWYLSEHKWKNFDLYTLLLVLPIASLSHVFIFLAFSDSPTYRFSFLQQSLVIFLFWAILILIILKESLDLCLIPDGFIFIFAGIAFAIESYMSGRGVVGLGGAVYGFLGGLAAFCAACCLYLSVRPSAFFAEFLLSSGLLLKGTWVLQVGLSLYTDAFGLKGCDKISGQTLAKGEIDVKCELQDDKWRGMVLMNLVFIVHVILVMTTSFVLFALLHQNRNMRWGQGGGLLPAEIGSESMLMHPLPELEME
ncbi:uncharacterized protein LOC105171744 [Sesamum indicum]|uniref:Uncharacterized protein LOC105171744 n=1 Tax=Sesamum indicum TaxID=4182 RepID=A0A6I9UB20_SESIN|nr:uncharacterized protein LOC105171744 [Sesamum indicum]XP_011091256.1 uncharacterized protein LOC105171744 [Sesamum indicum]XP_011091257.1 uncharacterized protein LOC105171744 [Sesamum indicum]XP_020552742.1 uncharacterized protein LOC105171744 [Sesamum indicum]XP_020552743.1 uncharacterized protein LOC105171744 [Sesamum indicum]